MDRVILHCDLNNFYASVECLYHPELWGFPVAVCGDTDQRHGIVLAKNQIAKSFGVKTGDVIYQALDKCPRLVTIRPNMALYQKFSRLVNDVYRRYSDRIQPFSIDESWIDLTHSVSSFAEGVEKAQEIRRTVREELGVTLSIGVSFNKIFAKLGSDLKKPDAVTPIPRERFQKIIWPLPCRELLYVGPVTEKKLLRVGIRTIGDIAQAGPIFLQSVLGKWGITIYAFAMGLDDSPVYLDGAVDAAKSVGNSTTTPRDIATMGDARQVVYMLADSVAQRLRQKSMVGKLVQVSLKDTGLCVIERQAPLMEATCACSPIADLAMALVEQNWDCSTPLRAIGVRTADLSFLSSGRQATFSTPRLDRQERLDACVDGLRRRFGQGCVSRGVLLVDPSLNISPIEDNTVHPTSFFKGVM
jgi:DNA polymerase-4